MFSHKEEGSRFDVYRTLTARIVEAIEAGAGEYRMPWHTSGPGVGRPANAYSGVAYRGVNVLALWAEAMICGYASGVWASYRQWAKLGAQVRRGEHGATIVFYKSPAEREDETEAAEAPGRSRLVARASRVFNAEQVAGWKPELPPTAGADSLAHVEAFVAGTQAVVRHGAEVACYRTKEDLIDMPAPVRFTGTLTLSPTEAYYAVLLHELTHWSGAAHRLDRTFGSKFGDAAYAMEELVAELGAAFLCADLAVTNAPRPDHAAYVGEWLGVMKGDRKAVFLAARLANQAVEYLRDLADQR